eukprot:CAMPEP_0206049976 /NCGR_PEP_ID=MMETSP1466-20131121/28068_1 /ASSEMBLY_ACC=CAM_ASM_001126 /TAXON_ID=44452 /ORGANISM="Pavlova gyrans, Strain CCMP608" /LENGTH=165 /DNA_ID=CAMNT_0053425079 /DNA_START=34 /DNA_END=531 /DNA_ORIENTATION=-
MTAPFCPRPGLAATPAMSLSIGGNNPPQGGGAGDTVPLMHPAAACRHHSSSSLYPMGTPGSENCACLKSPRETEHRRKMPSEGVKTGVSLLITSSTICGALALVMRIYDSAQTAMPQLRKKRSVTPAAAMSACSILFWVSTGTVESHPGPSCTSSALGMSSLTSR